MAEAETGTNALPAPNSYSNVSNPETIYLRIESNTGDFQVFEIELIVEPCTSTCTELDVDGFLQECVWQVVNLDGSDVLINYELEFNANQELVITRSEEHTSELQSRENLVCRLLLEKKNKKKKY